MKAIQEKPLVYKEALKHKGEKKEMKISIMEPPEIVGLEELLFEADKRFSTVSCVSKKGMVVSIEIDEFLR